MPFDKTVQKTTILPDTATARFYMSDDSDTGDNNPKCLVSEYEAGGKIIVVFYEVVTRDGEGKVTGRVPNPLLGWNASQLANFKQAIRLGYKNQLLADGYVEK